MSPRHDSAGGTCARSSYSSPSPQLAAIVPVDAEQEHARLGAVFASLFSTRCRNMTLMCNDPVIFVAWNDWSRIPGGFDVMRADNTSLSARIDAIAPYCDVANGSCDSEDHCREQMLNTTCIASLDLWRLELAQLQLRWWYSLKREIFFVARLLASCQVQGSDKCVQVVGSELAAREASVASLRPSFYSKLFTVVMFAPSIREIVANRPCSDKIPCLANILAPVLAAKEQSSVSNAIREALAAFEPDQADSAAFFAEVVRNASKPTLECGFYHTPNSVRRQECPLLARQLALFSENALDRNSWAYMTRGQEEQLKIMYDNCWLNCRLWLRVPLLAEASLRRRNQLMVSLVRYIRVLCDSPACLAAASNATWKAGEPDSHRTDFQRFYMSKLFVVMSICVDCLLIAVGLTVAFIAIGVWKVAAVSMTFLVMLSLTVSVVVLDLAVYITIFTRASIKSLDWAFALVSVW